MKSKILAATAVALFAVFPFAARVGAVTTNSVSQGQELVCGVNTVDFNYPNGVWGAEGTTQTLKELTVPSNLQGKTVSATADITNNGSVHPNTTITVKSGATNLTLSDVEASDGKVTTQTGNLTLDSVVDVNVTFGHDGVFSGDGDLTINVTCPSQSQVLACGVNNVTIPQTVVRGKQGDTSALAQLTVPADLQGKTVSVTAQTTNNSSVHPGTAITVSSNSTNLTLSDVEASDGKVTTATGNLTLGSVVDVTVTLGSDGVFSGGGSVTVTVDCGGGRGGVVLGTQVQQTPVGPVNGGVANSSSTVAGLIAAAVVAAAGLIAFRFRSLLNHR